MNFSLMLPLKDMALRRIAVFLANKPEFLLAIKHFPLHTFLKHENESKGALWWEVKHTISKLPLPASLRKEMMPILKAVASEILKWKFYYSWYSKENDEPDVKKLCWTTAGAIDYRKTSEKLVLSNVLNIVQRLELAYLYFLEDCLPALWNELPEREKRTYYKGTHASQVETPNMQFFLPFIFEKCCCLLPLPTRFRDVCYGCKYGVILSCKPAAEYFLNKLSKQERIAALVETSRGISANYWLTVTRSDRPEVLSYLLSLMTPEDQLRIFMRRPCEVLACFLYWPWQDLYLDIADVIFTFLDESLYAALLCEIKAHIRKSGFYLPRFIQELFRRSPIKFRKHVLDEECRNVFFFNEFLCKEDYGSIQVIFRKTDAVDKERLLLSREFLKLVDDFLLNDRWHVVEECIQLAMLSEEANARLKEAFAEFVSGIDDNEIDDFGNDSHSRKKKRKVFFEFLDRMKANTKEKRSVEGETLDKIKKICTGKEQKALGMN